MPGTLSILEINRMSPDDFSRGFGAVFEHSPWIAARAFAHRPFRSTGELHAAMREAVLSATPEERLALVRAHPELAGRAAQAGELTADSLREQQSAGLNALSPAELERIAGMNRAHAQKFGFPFIIAVRLNTKERIFSEFGRRLNLEFDEELSVCLEQIFLITGLRLRDLITE
jgi:OHCU decarboxylase